MASASVGHSSSVAIGDRLLACVDAQGSAAHPYLSSHSLLVGPHAARNLADAVHFLCMLHGRHPGVVDHAANRSVEATERSWFGRVLDGFAGERGFLTRLAVAAGPIPSTAGAGDNEAAVMSQRHAIEMLSRSERQGCALGAAMALLVDWNAIRGVLAVAAQRFGLEAPPFTLGDPEAVRNIAAAAAVRPAVERAMLFGAEQIVIQHFALWDLLEARQQARGDN